MGPNSHQLFLRDDIKVLHGNYARQGAGNAIRFQMEKDRFAYRYWFQGHVHRVSNYTAYSDDGSTRFGYEVGHMQMNPPLYGTGRPNDWVSGLALIRYNPSDDSPAEVHNLSFQTVLTDSGRYVVAHLEGNEYRVKYDSKTFANWARRTGKQHLLTSAWG